MIEQSPHREVLPYEPLMRIACKVGRLGSVLRCASPPTARY
jgi:hypothetical protein